MFVHSPWRRILALLFFGASLGVADAAEVLKPDPAKLRDSVTKGLGFLEKEADIKPGMDVFTSGVGGVFPYGVMIGKVKEFKKRELDCYATLVPAVDLSAIEDVFVVVGEEK